MLAEDMELAYDALKSVDALVAKSDGPHFLLATVHFVLNVKPARHQEGQPRSPTSIHPRRSGKSREGAKRRQAKIHSAADERDAPFSPRMWQSIRNGTVQF